MVLIQRQVADGVIEDHQRLCRTLGRTREEKAEMKGEQDGNKVSGMTHEIFELDFF